MQVQDLMIGQLIQTTAQGDTVVSGDTQWRALRTIDDTDDGDGARNTITPVEGDDWSEISTRITRCTGATATLYQAETTI